MMSYDKYERGRQHLNSGHQRITYKKKKKKGILTLRLTQSNQWVLNIKTHINFSQIFRWFSTEIFFKEIMSVFDIDLIFLAIGCKWKHSQLGITGLAGTLHSLL